MRARTFGAGGARQWRFTGLAALVLGLMALGAGMAWSAQVARQARLARLFQEEMHENQILRARQAALLDRAFELAKRVDAEAARWGGDVRAARSATEQICQEAEAVAISRVDGTAPCAPPRLRPAVQLRAAL